MSFMLMDMMDEMGLGIVLVVFGVFSVTDTLVFFFCGLLLFR